MRLAANVSLPATWLREDVLAVAGPDVATRRSLFDFVFAELKRLAELCPHRLTPVIRTLRNQRDDLLAFVAELDLSLAYHAAEHHVPVDVVREVLTLLSPRTTPQWPAEAALRQRLGDRFHARPIAVAHLADHTVRASSVVENINSRLRNYFFLRRHLNGEYLNLVRFYFNHHRLPQRTPQPRRPQPPRTAHRPNPAALARPTRRPTQPPRLTIRRSAPPNDYATGTRLLPENGTI